MSALPTSLLARTRELLASPRFVWVIVALAILLGLPSLDTGLVTDDLAQQAFIRQHQQSPPGADKAPWWNMFELVGGPRARTIGLRTSGRYPWWVDPDLRIVFFRPLSVATHHVDHWLWPDTLWLMHLHSVLWHALACALAWVLARRLSAGPTPEARSRKDESHVAPDSGRPSLGSASAVSAGLAALIYTLSFSHTIPVAWLAHRNGLVSTVFALAAVIAHDQWRRDRRRASAVLAPLSLLASLLSAEAGLVALGLLVAYACLLDRAKLSARVASLLPALVTVIGWRIAYVSSNFGAIGSGAYVDPLGDPFGFLDVFVGRYLWLLGVSFSPPILQLSAWLWLWLVLTVLVSVAVVVFAVRRRSPLVRFGLLALALGCVPLVTSHPGDRLLVLAGFATALVLGELLERWLFEPAPSWARVGAYLVVVVHVLAPPVAGVLVSSTLDAISERGSMPVYGAQLANQGLGRKGLVILHAPNYLSAEYLPHMRRAHGLEAPNFLWLLHEGAEAPVIERVDAQTLELRDAYGWPPSGFSAYWRSTSRSPFEVGETIKTVDFVATVLEVDDGRATRVRFRFRTALEHSSLAWASWDGHDFAPVDPRSIEFAK